MTGDICSSFAYSTAPAGNESNGTALSLPANASYDLADTSKLIAGCVSFLVVLPFVLFQFRRYPIGSAAACLVGGLLMVCSGVITQHEAYVILGSPESLRTIFLLLGMMLFSQYFEREQLINALLSKLLKSGLSFNSCLWRLCLISFFLSALFTNDACCVVLTPLALKWWRTQKKSQPGYDVETLLLGIATSANIGSSATIFGNPQNALLAARTDKPEFGMSRFDLRRSLMYIGPPAVVGYVLNMGMLLLSRKIHRHLQRGAAVLHPMSSEHQSTVQKGQSTSANIPLLDAAIQIEEVRKEPSTGLAAVPEEQPSQQRTDGLVSKPVLFLLAEEQQLATCEQACVQKLEASLDVVKSTGKKTLVFRVLLGVMMLLVVALFFASTEKTVFDMGLVPMGGAIILMAIDAGINRASPSDIIMKVDWSVLLMFIGIFVWLGGLNATHIPRYIWGRTGFMSASFHDAGEVAALSTFVTIGSNVFSNVPLTVVLMEQLIPCHDQLAMVLYISWTATVAGNLTLFGSVANLIVASKALETTGFRLTFWRYLRYGFPSTLIIGTVGVLLINVLLRIY